MSLVAGLRFCHVSLWSSWKSTRNPGKKRQCMVLRNPQEIQKKSTKQEIQAQCMVYKSTRNPAKKSRTRNPASKLERKVGTRISRFALRSVFRLCIRACTKNVHIVPPKGLHATNTDVRFQSHGPKKSRMIPRNPGSRNPQELQKNSRHQELQKMRMQHKTSTPPSFTT